MKLLKAPLLATAIAFVTGAYGGPSPWYAYPLQRVGQGQCFATDINGSGNIVGYTHSDKFETETIAFVTGPRGKGATTFGLGGTRTYAQGVNEEGTIVGSANIAEAPGSSFAIIADPGGINTRRLSSDPRIGSATAINDVGQVTGNAATPKGSRAFITGPGAVGIRLIENLVRDQASGVGINNSGQVLIAALGHPTGRHTYITGPNGKGLTDLGLEKGQTNFGISLNDQGEVTGYIQFKYIRTRQYITGPNGTDLKQLGYLGTEPGGGSFGLGINNSGIAVGVSSLLGAAGSPRVLTLADRQGHLVNLQDYIVNLPPGVNLGTTSGAINDRNQIAISGSDKRCYIVCPTEGCK